MLSAAKKTALQRFNYGIVTTFGKLDALEIAAVDGRPVQLATLLMKKYGWSTADAQHKVDLFMTQISSTSQ
jgi:hypothetical protein